MRQIILILLTFFGISYGFNNHYNAILYYKDTLHSYIQRVYKSEPENESISVVNSRTYNRYLKSYKHLPEGFIQTGNLLMYQAKDDVSFKDIVSAAIPYTDFYSIRRCSRAIRKLNSFRGNEVSKGEVLIIPNSIAPYLPVLTKGRKNLNIEAAGLYFTGTSTGAASFLKKIKSFKKSGVNTIVFDAKDVTGIVTYYSNVPFAKKYNTHRRRSIHNIRKLIRECQKNEIHLVARLAVFHDHLLAKAEPSLAIQSRSTGGIWNAGSRELWCDPTNKKVQDYTIQLALELADMGVDEIQFDYIRFPTAGKLSDTQFRYDFGKMTKEQTIAHFLKRAYKAISAKDVLVSIDIFGVVAWGKKVDIRKTGQDITMLAQYCDIISPMLYPSHFNNDFNGFTNPGDHPYHFLYEGCKKVINLSRKKVVVRPWLQAFGWRVSNYNESYIVKQIKGTSESGGRGYLFWNAKNNYDTVLRALRSI